MGGIKRIFWRNSSGDAKAERKGEREKENNKVFDFYDGRTVIFDVLHRV